MDQSSFWGLQKSMEELGSSINGIAKAIKEHSSISSFTPTLTKKQWVRDAAVRIAAAGVQKTGVVLNSKEYAHQSIEIAQEIWDATI